MLNPLLSRERRRGWNRIGKPEPKFTRERFAERILYNKYNVIFIERNWIVPLMAHECLHLMWEFRWHREACLRPDFLDEGILYYVYKSNAAQNIASIRIATKINSFIHVSDTIKCGRRIHYVTYGFFYISGRSHVNRHCIKKKYL